METKQHQQFQPLDQNTATAFLRESAVQRQQQSGKIDQSKIESIRNGQQDQSLGMDDAVYGLTNADKVWDGLSAGKQNA